MLIANTKMQNNSQKTLKKTYVEFCIFEELTGGLTKHENKSKQKATTKNTFYLDSNIGFCHFQIYRPKRTANIRNML